MDEAEKIQTTENGRIKSRDITQEMTESYIDYAMSVIVSRALPDVRDGLKPVQRRILYAMHEMGLSGSAKYRKSAAITGFCMGAFHPHGDTPIYEAMARMAQDFSLRYPLIDGQGNWGSIDSDPPAAQRYTEARLSKVGVEILKDIEKDTVDFIDNYDGTRQEPVVLPSPLPQLLLNGTMGIAVGMATNIPPHNLLEVCEALIHLLEHPDAGTLEILKFIKGPDFPTGGIIYDANEIAAAYSLGKGSIIIRGKTEIITKEKNTSQIIIKEIPFQTSKAKLLESFARLVEKKQIEGIKDIRDESDRQGMRIVVELFRGAFPQKILNQFFKFTELQKSFHLNMIALIDGLQPRILSIADVLQYFLTHKKEVLIRRAKFDLTKNKERAHILEGLQKCLTQIDAVIRTIKTSANREKALQNLVKKFSLSEIQARAILEIKLQQLAKLERERIDQELAERQKLVKELEALLKSPKKIKELIKKELNELKENYGDDRKTKVVKSKVFDISEQDLIPQKETVIILTKKGFIKRVKPESYNAQKKGGRGVVGAKIGQDDIISHFLLAQTHDLLLFFTDAGKIFQLSVYEIPEGTRTWRGKNIVNFLDILPEEKILEILPRKSILDQKKEEQKNRAKYFLMVTEKGIIKKTALKEFKNVRKSGLVAIKLKKNDLLKKVIKTSGQDLIILISKKGKAILFREKEMRAMGRTAVGNKGMRLSKEDKVIGAGVVQNLKSHLLTISTLGIGKRTAFSRYRIQKRSGTGLKTAKLTNKTGDLAAAEILNGQEEHLIIISQKGQVIKMKVSAVRILSRVAQGVKLIRLMKGDKVSSMICI